MSAFSMTSAKVFAAPKVGARSTSRRGAVVVRAEKISHGKGGEEGGAVLGNDAFGMVAKVASYSMFATAAQKTGVRATLESPGPITVFAVNDAIMEAFCASSGKSKMEFYEHPNLAGILNGHIVQGAYKLEDLTEGTQLTTLAGTTITIRGGAANNAKFTKNDIKVDNAVLHAVDALIQA